MAFTSFDNFYENIAFGFSRESNELLNKSVRSRLKRRPKSGGGGLSNADILRTRGEGCSSDAGVCTFWSKKLRTFRNLWCVRTDKGGGWPVRTFFGKGEGSIFRDFMRTSFMDGP